MEIASSTILAIVLGASISALYYIGYFLLLIVYKLFHHSSDNNEASTCVRKRTHCSSYTVIFPIFCALIYSVYLYITADGSLRFPPLISCVFGFFLFSRYLVAPLKRLASTMTKARKDTCNYLG